MELLLQPCEDTSLQDELTKEQNRLKSTMTEIIADINNLVLPPIDGLLNGLADIIASNPSNEVTNLSDLANLLGLPYNTDLERLALLGLGVIGDIGYKLEGDNFDRLRSLYLMGSRLSLSSRIELIQTNWIMEREVFETKQDIKSFLTRGYAPFDVYEEIVGDKYAYYLKRETLSSVNTPRVTGTLCKAFSYQTYNDSSAAFLRNLNAGLNTVAIEDMLLSIVNAELVELNTNYSIYLQTISDYNHEYVQLQESLYPFLKQKNTDDEIITAIRQNYIMGVNTEITDEDLGTFIQSVMNVPAGTHALSSLSVNSTVNNKRFILTKLLVLLTKMKTSELKEIQDFALDVLADIQKTNSVVKPNITYKSYDSGSVLVNRNVSLRKTLRISYEYYYFKKDGSKALAPIATEAIDLYLDTAYASLENSTKLLGAKVNDYLKALESVCSLGLSITGGGAYENSFFKCAAGIDVNLDFNPLGLILNPIIDLINALIIGIQNIMRKILRGIQCGIRCIRDALGLGGVGLDLPFCDIKIPELLKVPDLMKFAGLFDNLLLKNISSLNSLRISLIDLSDSFSEIGENSCGCVTMSGLLGSLRNSVGIPSAASNVIKIF